MKRRTVVPNEINDTALARQTAFAPYFVCIGGFIVGVALTTFLFVYLQSEAFMFGDAVASMICGVLGLSVTLDGFSKLKRGEDNRD